MSDRLTRDLASETGVSAEWLDDFVRGVHALADAPVRSDASHIVVRAAAEAQHRAAHDTRPARRRTGRGTVPVLRRGLVFNLVMGAVLLIGTAALAIGSVEAGFAPDVVEDIVVDLSERIGFTVTPPAENPTDAPGLNGATPGQSELAPGKAGNVPARGDGAPGQTGTAPGQSGNTPGLGGDNPAEDGTAPGLEDNPGLGEDGPPGQGDNPPGQEDDGTPGNSGDNPGQGDSPPGQEDDSDDGADPGDESEEPADPGEDEDAPGNSGPHQVSPTKIRPARAKTRPARATTTIHQQPLRPDRQTIRAVAMETAMPAGTPAATATEGTGPHPDLLFRVGSEALGVSRPNPLTTETSDGHRRPWPRGVAIKVQSSWSIHP